MQELWEGGQKILYERGGAPNTGNTFSLELIIAISECFQGFDTVISNKESYDTIHGFEMDETARFLYGLVV